MAIATPDLRTPTAPILPGARNPFGPLATLARRRFQLTHADAPRAVRAAADTRSCSRS